VSQCLRRVHEEGPKAERPNKNWPERLIQPRMAVGRSDGAEAESPRFESIEELFLALESALLSYARRLAPNSDMAEDFVQDAFVRLHAQFDQVRAPRNWLYRTVHNLALNHRRSSDKIVALGPASGSDAESGFQARKFEARGIA
jgi:DNA-directed RNA polymerase specialized sigma24 family protein